MASGSKACTFAPDSRSAVISAMDGASRMSSVLGLNARPQMAIVFPFNEAKGALFLRTWGFFPRLVPRLPRLRDLKVVGFRGGEVDLRFDFLGKAVPAVADAGKEERAANAPIGADRTAH